MFIQMLLFFSPVNINLFPSKKKVSAVRTPEAGARQKPLIVDDPKLLMVEPRELVKSSDTKIREEKNTLVKSVGSDTASVRDLESEKNNSQIPFFSPACIYGTYVKKNVPDHILKLCPPRPLPAPSSLRASRRAKRVF
jgi:hypothetical protein